VRLAVAILAVLLLAAPSAAAQDVATALRGDTVYVDPDASVSVDADALRRSIADEELDVRIAVLPDSVDAAAEARELAAEVGGDVAVITGDSIAAGPSSEAADAADAAVERGGSTQDVATAFVEEAGSDGFPGGLILLALAGAGGAAVAIGRSRRRRREAVEFAEVKDNARDDLVALGDDIRALDLDIEMPGVSKEARADYETAVTAYDRADQTWRLARRPNDLEPVGAALEEGRWAMQSARARLDGREPPERRSPCFFDPRHGPSTREVEWAPYGGESRLVPACEADAVRVEGGDDPEAREVTVGGQRMPYWAAGPMYAPFMGGFFGAGLLPGLLIGTSLGGFYDAPDTGGDFGGGDWGGGDFGGGDFGGGDF
jgi:hypothetical protein